MTKTIINRIAEPPKSGSKITKTIIKNEITVGPNKLCQICPGINFPSRLDKTKANKELEIIWLLPLAEY